MIDRTKNLCYIVNVHYLIRNGTGFLKNKKVEFISLHSINTKKCQVFAKCKAKEDKQFLQFDDDDGWISQRTIPLSDYCK